MTTLPPSVAAALPDEPWVPLSGPVPGGEHGWPDHTWPGRSWSVGDRIVRLVDPGKGAVIDSEVARLGWLQGRIAVPDTVVVEANWLVLDSGDAAPSHRPESQPEPDLVPTALGEALRVLHELDVESCPFSRSWSAVVDELTSAIDGGRIRIDHLREPYCRYEPRRLLELVVAGRPAADDDAVVAHGGLALSNILLAAGRPAAFLGVHRLGVSDRHLDLAVMTNQLRVAFGPESLYGFYEGYGRDPDLVRLDHFILIDAMSAAVEPILERS